MPFDPFQNSPARSVVLDTFPDSPQRHFDSLHQPGSPDQTQHIPVVLTPTKIPGAVLPKPNISDNTVKDLQRWLKCRAVPVGKARKATLVSLYVFHFIFISVIF